MCGVIADLQKKNANPIEGVCGCVNIPDICGVLRVLRVLRENYDHKENEKEERKLLKYGFCATKVYNA